MLRSDPASLERRVSLAGADATAWLEARGFATSPSSPGFRLLADAYRASDLALARILRGPGETRQGGAPTPATSLSAVTEGSLELLLPTGGVLVQRGQAVLMQSNRVFGTRNTAPVATIEIVLGSASSSRFDHRWPGGPVLVGDEARGIRALSALANEILGSAEPSSVPLTAGYRIAFEAIASDVLDDSGCDLPLTIGPADRRLLLRARRIIRARFAEPGFSVRLLAADLAVTERRLQRAFAATGSTAQESLRRARAEAAHTLLRTHAAVTHVELELVAHQVGLPGGRALKDHFAACGLSIPRHAS
jgi:AraC-like DNA-binding protein